MCLLMAPLWQAALKILSPGDLPQKVPCSHIEWFYRPSCSSFYGPPCTVSYGADIWYERIWKNANRAVSCNLARMFNKEDKPLDRMNLRDRNNTAPMTHFTLIREPMSRFVSGYAEVESRWYYHRWEPGRQRFRVEPYRRKAFGSEARARSFIHDIFTGHLDPNWLEYSHVFLQSPTFRTNSGLEVMGTMESCDEAWKRINIIANKSSPWSWECGRHHETIADERAGSAGRSAMQHLITNRSIALALSCGLLLPDHVCFGYSMTTQPADCVSAGFTIDGNSTWEHVVSRIRSIHCPDGIKWYRGASLPATSAMSR